LLTFFALLFLFAMPLGAREITDMAGRRVTIPEQPRRVFGSAPPLNVLLHAIDPDVMIGLSFPVPPEARAYFPEHVARLPVLGGVFGMGPNMNSEAVMALHPDIALAWKSPFVDAKRVDATFARMGLPVVFIKIDTLADWPAALRFTGQLLGQAQKGEEEARYVEAALARLQTLQHIPEARRLRVYYAEGADGLATDCHESFHTEAIELARGYNVYRCTPQSHTGMERVSLEQILVWQPDIILTHDRTFLAEVRSAPRWQAVKAVREGRIHIAPRWPHNWIDRPPSMIRALGAQWLANLLYPQEFPLDIKTETRHFYRLFLQTDLTDAQLEALFR
jgi:iron complex transport system substrate-binding protein